MNNVLDDSGLARTYFHSPQGAGRAALGHVDGANPASGAYRYYTHDHLGSTRGVYDHAKTRLARFDYTPYGETYHAENPGITTRQFTGHDWSPQTGLYFAPYRYYNPAASRWLTREPSGLDGPNMYHYTFGNPVMLVDVRGEFAFVLPILGGAIGGAIVGGINGFMEGDIIRGAIGGAIQGSVIAGGVMVGGAGIGSVIGGAIGGVLGGAINSGITGRPWGGGMLNGALSGAVGGGINWVKPITGLSNIEGSLFGFNFGAYSNFGNAFCDAIQGK